MCKYFTSKLQEEKENYNECVDTEELKIYPQQKVQTYIKLPHKICDKRREKIIINILSGKSKKRK